MKALPTSVPAPKLFCSPGMERLLVRESLVLEEEIRRAYQTKRNQQILHALAERRLLDLTTALPKLAEVLEIPLLDLDEDSFDPLVCEPLLERLGFETALSCRILPLEENDQIVRCAMSDPLDLEASKRASFLLGADIEPVLCAEKDIIDKIRFFKGESGGDVDDYDTADPSAAGDSIEVLATERVEKSGEKSGATAPPIVRLVNRILADAARADASDVHMLPTSSNLEIKFRIDGIMHPHLIVPKRLQPYVLSRTKLLSKMDIAERRRPQDGRLRMRIGKHDVRDVRVSSVPTPFGEKLVLRLLKPDGGSVSLSASGMPESTLADFQEHLRGSDRIVLVVGPTGSGKSTTLYGGLSFLNTGENTIVTVEDPIEYRLEGVTQIEADSKIGMTFASGLRSILRQDPDVILVGEIRDPETAEMAFQAAQTGHLVLSTLHTNDAPSAVVRLRDIGLEPFIIAGSLSAVLAQRLVRRLCLSCRRKATAEELDEQRAKYGRHFETLWMPVGCAECNRMGYRGRAGVFSLLPVSSEVRELIREDAGEGAISRAGRAAGMKTLAEAGLELVDDGTTSLAELERVIGSANVREALALLKSEPEQPPKKTEVASGSEQATRSEAPPTASTSRSIADIAEELNRFDGEEGGAQIHVLIVDDDKGVRAVMAASLRKAGFQVTEAANGAIAYEKLKEIEDIQAVVCDLDMPQVSGREFLLNVRDTKEFKTLPVLMLTGWDSEEKEMDLIKAGASDFVSKSSSPALVIARLRRILK